MDDKKIKALVDLVSKNDLGELYYKEGEDVIRIRRHAPVETAAAAPMNYFPMMAGYPPMPAPHAPTGAEDFVVPATPVGASGGHTPKVLAATERTDLLKITAPIVGTFYRSPSPDKPAFVEKGDIVEPGQTVCIIEAMKLMNEIHAEARGRIVEISTENSNSVEWGQVLFPLEPA